MNKEKKQKWTNALINGEYKKAAGSLKTIHGFCCLGVLCDLYYKETGKGGWNAANAFIETNTGQVWKGLLPMEVIEWGEITEPEIYQLSVNDNASYALEILKFTYTLAGMNDTGSDFIEIAEIINKNF